MIPAISFDANAADAHACQLFCLFHIVLNRVDGADGIANCTLGVCPFVDDSPDCYFQVAEIVESVKAAENIHAVINGFFDELNQHIIGVVPVTYNVLSSQQHLGFGFFKVTPDNPSDAPRGRHRRSACR